MATGPSRQEDKYPPYKEYYFEGADLHLLVCITSFCPGVVYSQCSLKVKGIRFAVYSYFFNRDSGYWKNNLAQLDYPGAPGSDESTPLILDEDPEDVASFLWVWYNP
jgi:hypothetical protein